MRIGTPTGSEIHGFFGTIVKMTISLLVTTAPGGIRMTTSLGMERNSVCQVVCVWSLIIKETSGSFEGVIVVTIVYLFFYIYLYSTLVEVDNQTVCSGLLGTWVSQRAVK